VYNPFAGGLKGPKRARLDGAVRALQNAGATVTLYETPGPNLAGMLAKKASDEGCDLILASGGDGTINEAINGLAHSQVVFGALPAGTANVLGKEVGLAMRPDQAAAQIKDAVPTRVALGLLERPGQQPRHFALMAGIGLDARIVYDLDPDLKRKYGKLAYWQGGFRQMGQTMPTFNARIDGKDYPAGFVLATRVRNYGGDFEIARKIRLTDNDFEVVIFQNHQWHHYLRFVGAVITNRLHATPGVHVLRAKQIEISASPDDRVYIQTDGEAVGRLPAKITIVPDALTLLLPQTYLNKQ
jgi:diacylglycerol kinase (ATP)